MTLGLFGPVGPALMLSVMIVATVSDLSRRRLLPEHPCRQWHSRERIEDNPDLERH
jgi:hypothetical protein